MKKRVLSILMSIAMLAGAVPVAMAETATTPGIINLLKDGTSFRNGVDITAGANDAHGGVAVTPTLTYSSGASSLLDIATDGSTGTWSHFHGYDCYYQVDLGTVRSITNIEYKVFSSAGPYMKDNYSIYVSNDPTFTDDPEVATDVVEVFKQPEVTNGEEPTSVTVDLSAEPKQYRYIRIKKLNTSHTGISLSEIAVQGYDEYYEQNLTAMDGVLATSPFEGYVNTTDILEYCKDPANVIDGKYTVALTESGTTDVASENYSAWISSFGLEAPYVQVDLTAVRELSKVRVLPYRGSEVAAETGAYFRRGLKVLASNTEDFKDETTLYDGTDVTAERDTWIEIDLSSAADYYRYIRVVDTEDVIGIAEIEVFGYDVFDVEVASSTIIAGATDVTNINTTEIPTVKTSMALDRDTVNSTTVYALRQVPVYSDGSVTETKVTINPVMIDDYTIGIDLATLKAYNDYKIVVSGVKTTDGMTVLPYTSGVFKTGLIAPVAYVENSKIVNAAEGTKAAGQTVTSDESGNAVYTTVDLSHFVDGSLAGNTASFISNKKAFVSVYSETNPNYAYIDLGSAKNIKAVSVLGGDSWWYHYAPFTFYGTNTDPTTVTDPIKDTNAVQLTSITSADVVNYGDSVSMWGTSVANGGKWSVTKAPAKAVNASENYRFIIMQVPSDGSKSPIEVMVYTSKNITEMVESVSIPDGTKGLTNVSNAVYFNKWNYSDDTVHKTYINNGAPIEIKLSQDADMQTVTNETVKLSKIKKTTDAEEATKVNYTPIIDAENKTLKIDLSELETYQGMSTRYLDYSYRIEITSGVTNADGSVIAKPGTVVNFTTGMIADVPYAEGKIIKNVALDKTLNYATDPANTKAPQNIGTYSPYLINGLYGAGDNDIYATEIKKDNAVMIDLGNKYDIKAIGWTVSNQWNFHFWNINWYFQNDNSFDVTDKTADYSTGETKTLDGNVPVSPEASRYVLVDTTSDIAYPRELVVYAYVDAEKPDVYFTSPKIIADDGETVLTKLNAKVENAGTKTLILAEYKGGALVNAQSVVATNGTATISVVPVEGNTYKAFVWDSLTGLTPATKSIQY